MFCTHCGNLLSDQAVVCPKCGVPTNNFNQVKEIKQNKFYSIAKIFMIIGCVFNAFYFLIPLAWCIPMTVHVSKSEREGKAVGIAFKICTLIFVNLISGILLLCADEN